MDQINESKAGHSSAQLSFQDLCLSHEVMFCVDLGRREEEEKK